MKKRFVSQVIHGFTPRSKTDLPPLCPAPPPPVTTAEIQVPFEVSSVQVYKKDIALRQIDHDRHIINY